MKLNEKWTLFLIATFVTFLGIVDTLFRGTRATTITVEEQRQAILETAHTYYRQGVQLQYDSFKKNLYSTPEDATSQHYTYTVCSGFTFQVYYQTLGIKIPDTTEELLDYAEENQANTDTVLAFYKTSDVIYSEDVLGTAEESNYSNLAKEWVNILLPGDIIVVTGHAFMVDSIDYENEIVYIIESRAGDRYNYDEHYDNFDKNGTIQYRDLNTKLKVYYNRINNGNTLLERVAVIRFITDGESYINTDNEEDTYNVTASVLSRLKYPNIDIEKTVKVSNEDATVSQNVLLDLGDTITYEITIKNNSSFENNPYIEGNTSGIDYGSFEVIENIDSRLEITDLGGGTLENNQLKWNYSNLSSGDIITISYTVKIPNDTSLLGEIILSTGLVGNIATSKIESLIGNKLNKEDKSKLLDSFDKLKDNSSVERDFINDIYIDAFELDLGLSNELSNFDIISYDSSVVTGGNDVLSVKTTKVNDTAVSKYIYNNFYGLRIGKANDRDNNIVRAILQWNIYSKYETNDRARTLTEDMLIDGDVILVYLGDSSTDDENLIDKSYIYLNDKLVRKTAVNEFEELTDDELTVFLRNIIGDNYVILRPSISMERTYDEEDEYVLEFDSSLIVDNENKYIKYIERATKVDELLGNIEVMGYDIKISNNGNNKDNTDVLASGDVLAVYLNEEIKEEYTISVIGDSNGDGKLDLIDLVQMRKHIVGWINPDTNEVQRKTGIYYYSLDFNKDGEIDLIDLVRMRKAIVGMI